MRILKKWFNFFVPRLYASTGPTGEYGGVPIAQIMKMQEAINEQARQRERALAEQNAAQQAEVQRQAELRQQQIAQQEADNRARNEALVLQSQQKLQETIQQAPQIQQASNIQQAKLDQDFNRFNQTGPTGSVEWVNTGTAENPQYQQKTSFSPELQGIFGNVSQNANQISGEQIAGADDVARQRIEAALFERLNPQLQLQKDALDTKLANQGLAYGGEAYGKAQDDYNRATNDARLAVVAQGGQEQQLQQQMEMTRRNQAASELSGILGLAPQYTGQTNVNTGQPVDVASMLYGGNRDIQGQIFEGNEAGNQRIFQGGEGTATRLAGGTDSVQERLFQGSQSNVDRYLTSVDRFSQQIQDQQNARVQQQQAKKAGKNQATTSLISAGGKVGSSAAGSMGGGAGGGGGGAMGGGGGK